MGLGSLLDAAMTFLRTEFENVRRFDVPWRRRLWLYRHGFLSSKDAIWDLSAATVDDYLSDVDYRALGRLGGPYVNTLSNKLLFHLLVSQTHAELVPTVYALLREGEVLRTRQFDGLASVDELVDRLATEPLVVKPVTAEKADGIRMVDGSTGQLRLDGRELDRRELLDSLTTDRDLLVMERVEHGAYADSIFPDATNTIRLLTMIDPESGEPFIAAAAHRFGTDASAPVDNWVAGGLSARIDVETGDLGRAVWQPAETATWSDTHPDTGAEIAGTAVPEWDRIVSQVLDLASTYGWLWPHVGWDIVVQDEDGSIAVLEGELMSGGTDLQAHGPLLADERVRRFYRENGVLVAPGDAD